MKDIRLDRGDDLGDPLEAAKGGTTEHAVAIALKRGPLIARCDPMPA